MVRALENGRSRWLVLAGVVLGFAFLAKMLQAFLVVPAFALAYLWAGPPRLAQADLAAAAGRGRHPRRRRLVGAVAELVPAADRPYFGGSTNNNILQLAIGYNGLGRLTGSETGSIGGGGGGGRRGGGGFGGATGITRLFSAEFGGQISWLLPAALICLAGMLWVSRRAARTDRTRAAALLWGGWLVVHRGGVQLHERHHPPVLHGRARPGDRRAGQRGRDGAVGAAAGMVRPDHGRGDGRRHRVVGSGPARPVAVLAAVAPLGDRGGRRGRGGLDPGGAVADGPAGLARRRRGAADG